MEVPFIIERVVVADRDAAALDRGSRPSQAPVFAPPFEGLSGSDYWWEPVRRTLATYLDVYETGKGKRKEKPVVTYIERQIEEDGPRIRDADHQALVAALWRMGRDYGYEIHVVSEKETGWDERMTAVVKSTVSLTMPHFKMRSALTVIHGNGFSRSS